MLKIPKILKFRAFFFLHLKVLELAQKQLHSE